MTISNTIKFTNCKILRRHELINDDLWVRDGKIIDPEKIFYEEKCKANIVIDVKGNIVSAGFIDIQINGGFGIDFSHNIENVEEGLNKVAKEILSHGVTAFCPTLVTSDAEVYAKIITRIKKQKGGKHGAEIIGIHAEGPFISKEKKGAHNSDFILEFSDGVNTLKNIYKNLENIKIVTLAPEKKNSLEVIKYLSKEGITVSLGHSMADINTSVQAVNKGARLMTHLFNAMLPFHHRDPGLVGLLASQCYKNIFYGIIADGVHTHPSALRIAHKTHSRGLVLVTDAISAMGLPDGTHFIGDLSVEIRNKQAFIAGTSTLCGSIATMNECVQFFKQSTSCSTVEALEAASLHPAQALRIDHYKGSLDFGCDADLVILDDNLNVLTTWIAGETVYAT